MNGTRTDWATFFTEEHTIVGGASPHFFFWINDPERYAREIGVFPVISIIRDNTFLASFPFTGNWQTNMSAAYGDAARVVDFSQSETPYTFTVPPFVPQVRRIRVYPRIRKVIAER